MDTAIRLCYPSHPAAPARLGSGAKWTATRQCTSRVHLRLSHGSVCVSHHPISRPLHINCMLERFCEGAKSSTNDENGKKIVRGMTRVSLVLACVLGAFSLSGKMNPKSHLAYASWPWNVSSTTAASADTHKSEEAPSEAEIEGLKLYAMAVSKFVDESKAVTVLKNEYEKWKHTPESEHFLEMALVELLLKQGKYTEASEVLDNRIRHLLPPLPSPTDSQASPPTDQEIISILQGAGSPSMREICLYKAIIDTKLKKKDAAKWWEAFKSEILTTSPLDIRRHPN